MITATMIDERTSGIQRALDRKDANFSIRSSSSFKNNVSRDGIMLDSGAQISPVVYPTDELWAKSDDEIADYLIDMEDDIADGVPNFDFYEAISRENILKKVLPRLYGNSNRARMEENDRVYTEFLDFLIGFYLPIDISKDGISSVSITKAMLLQTDLTLNEVRKAAQRNIQESYKIESINKIMSRFMGVDIDEDMAIPNMLVVTNEQNVNGAATILSDKVLEELTETLGNEFVILPSSIHEVICIPSELMEDAEVICDMVKEINTTQVRPEDKLTDSVYVCADKVIRKVA